MTTLFPPSPLPGSNAIGEFTIGVSPIGDIQPFIWQETILSQYANSPIILSLLQSFNDAMDLAADMDAFYDKVWNVLTAQGWGLDVWGRIVGVGRVLQVVSGPDYFGFEEALPGPVGFNQGVFYSGQPITGNYALTDDAYRVLILAKAAANICGGSIPEINAILRLLFPGRGNCYVADDGGMEMTYTFEFPLTEVEESIVFNSGVLPAPTGVVINYSIPS